MEETTIQTNPVKELRFRITLTMFIGVLVVTLLGFGGVSIYFLLNDYLLIGILLALATVALVVGLVMEHRNANMLVTTEGVYQHDFLNRETYILWENCNSIFKDARRSVTYIDLTQTVRDPGSVSAKNKLIMVPWSRFSKQQKEDFLTLVAASTAPEYVKAEFFKRDFPTRYSTKK